MADVAIEPFDGVLFAIDINASSGAWGAVNTTIRDLVIATPLTEAMGVVIGDREAGDAQSGITLPDFEPVRREMAVVGYTARFASFVREAFGDIQIAYHVKGNGATIQNPAQDDDCKPTKGIDALNQIAGLSGTGAALAPVYKYTPRATQLFATISMWWGDLRFCWQDCTISERTTVYTPGGYGIRTDTIKLGAIVAAGVDDGVAFVNPTASFQTLMAAPSVVGTANTWSEERGWRGLEITINNNVEEFEDCNVPLTGMKFRQTSPRSIIASVTGLRVGTVSDYEYDATKLTADPSDTFSFQVGTVGVADAQSNAYLIELENPQVNVLKYDRAGDELVADVTLDCRDDTAGAEYTETYN